MRRFRIRTVLITGSAALVVLVALIFAALAARDLSTLASSEPDATFALRSKLIDTAIILMAGLLLSSAWVGGRLSARLKTLRAEFVDLARGDRTEPLTRSRFTELDALSVATGRLVQDMRARFELAERRTQAIGELVESGTEGLLHISAAKRIVYANHAARDLMGLPADCEGQSVTALIRQAELRELIGRAVSGETPPPTELALDDRQLVVHCHPLANGRGAVAAILDLTDVRRLEAVRRDFVANVSHELKTPLTSIRGYAETLLGEEVPPELRRQFLEVIHKNTGRVQRIIDDLLDLSRLQSGGWSPETRQVNAAEVAEDVWINCVAAARKHVEFKLEARNAPWVAADPDGLRQVFSNLFDNALRYTPEGGQVIVRIEPGPNGDVAAQHRPMVEIQVRDSGSGIPRDALPRIFERFYRVDPARSRAEGGTGLGLSIVKHLIERMAGEVSAESELGKGTTIRFHLPAA